MSFLEDMKMCQCTAPEKQYSKTSCHACWTCAKCGKFGGCDNLAYYDTEPVTFSMEPFGAPPPFPAELLAGRSSEWDKVRDKAVKDHPYCAACEGKTILEVHHKKPFHLYPELELEPSNLIVLCRRDHFAFGHLFDWHAYNPNVDEDVISWRYKIKGRLYV